MWDHRCQCARNTSKLHEKYTKMAELYTSPHPAVVRVIGAGSPLTVPPHGGAIHPICRGMASKVPSQHTIYPYLATSAPVLLLYGASGARNTSRMHENALKCVWKHWGQPLRRLTGNNDLTMRCPAELIVV